MDGGWSKRSYNAKSGVAEIIGKETGNHYILEYTTNTAPHVLNMNVPVKNLPIMTAKKIGMAHPHQWRQTLYYRASSKQMNMGRYTKFIGDEDSSVFPTLVKHVPMWGYAIKKKMRKPCL